MNKETVKYGNELNMVVFQKFTAVEMDLFFVIVSKMKDKGLSEVVFSFDELKHLSNYKPTATKRFIADLNSTYDKMMDLKYSANYSTENQLNIKRFVLFPGFNITADKENGEIVPGTGKVAIKVNPELVHVLNDLRTWTTYSLKEFVDLKSVYSKYLFRLLKQFRTKGLYTVKIEDFRELLDVPPSYKVAQIDQKIINPAIKELQEIFPKLAVKKNKARTKGSKVLGYEFTWQSEKTGKYVEGKFDSKPSDKPASKPGNSAPAKRKASKKETVPAHITDESLRTETPIDPEVGAEVAKRIAGLKSSGKKGQDGE